MKTIKTLTFIPVLILFQNGVWAQKLSNKIEKSVASIENSFSSIQENRRALLEQMASRIHKEKRAEEKVNILLIDKDNRTSSQLAAIWLKTGLLYYELDGYNILSAGLTTEARPFTQLSSLEPYGFKVSNASRGELFSYSVDYGSKSWPVKFNTVESLGLNNEKGLHIYLEEGIAPENEPKKVTIPLFAPDTIAREMLYVASRINYLTEKTTEE